MEEGGKPAEGDTSGSGEPTNGRAHSQEPVASYLTMDSLMKCGFVR